MSIAVGSTPTPAVTPALPPIVTPVPTCVGDCDDGGAVTIDELVIGVNVALEIVSIDQCAALDSDASRTVTVDELLQGVRKALYGCGQGGSR